MNKPFLLNLNIQFFSDNPPADPPEKTFTQEEVNEIVTKRLAKVKPPADYEELKNKLKEYEQKDLTEFDKIKQQLSDKETLVGSLETELNSLKEKQKQDQINQAFKAAAQKAGIEYVEDAMRLTDMTAFTIGEDGTVEGLEDIVKKLAEEKPFLLSKHTTEIGGSANPGNQERIAVTKEQFQKMNYMERAQLHESNPELYRQLNTK